MLHNGNYLPDKGLVDPNEHNPVADQFLRELKLLRLFQISKEKCYNAIWDYKIFDRDALGRLFSIVELLFSFFGVQIPSDVDEHAHHVLDDFCQIFLEDIFALILATKLRWDLKIRFKHEFA